MYSDYIFSIIRFILSWFKYRDYFVKKAYLTSPVDVDITDAYKKEKRYDADVTYKVVYMFNNKEYIYVTRVRNHVWPPRRKMTFCAPVRLATLENEDVTAIVRKYAGPFNDFHNETVTLSDMGFPEGSVLELTNILGDKYLHKSSVDLDAR